MEKFTYGIEIKGKKFSCTGNQLVKILQFIGNRFTGSWYCDDVDASKKDKNTFAIKIEKTKKIGSINDFINFSLCTGQKMI